MPADFAPRFDLASLWHAPVKERVVARHAHAVRARLHMLEKGRKPPDDLALAQRVGDANELIQWQIGLIGAALPGIRCDLVNRKLTLQ